MVQSYVLGDSMTLSEFFKAHNKAAIAFSGGVDSAYLLHAAMEAGCDIKAYFIKTPFQPAFELEDAKKLCPHVTVLELDILQFAEVASNPDNRCYYCKKHLFSHLKQQADTDGYDEIWDGTNASDSYENRPGMRALEELGVLSPLRLCSLKKEDIREFSERAGLFTWNKPAYACLATRIPTGIRIDRNTLSKIEAAEGALYALGYRDLRVRVFHSAARLQLPLDQFPTGKDEYIRIQTALKPWFSPVLLDLEGR